MRVVIVIRSQSGVPGGAGVPGGQIGMIQLARALGRLGVEVELFVGGGRMGYLGGLEGVTTTYFRWPALVDRLIKLGPAPVRAIGASARRRRWLDAVAALPRIGSADIIHVQGLLDAESLLTRFRGPLVVTHWGRVKRWRPREHDADGGQRLRHRIQRIQENVTLVAIGEAQRAELASVGLPPVSVIPPGIDLRHFTPGDREQARRKAGLPASDGIVLYVGRLAADKNVETLLRAFALRSRHSGTRLLIIGDGPLRAQLEGLSDDLGIGTAVTFLRFVPHNDLPIYYQACDVTVVPSDRLETFCMVALEAIACDCPLIVTDQVPEIIQRFPAVPSVTPYDIEGLRHQIDAALDGKVPPAGSTGMADYDWTGVARRYLDVYQSALRQMA